MDCIHTDYDWHNVLVTQVLTLEAIFAGLIKGIDKHIEKLYYDIQSI